MKKLLLFAIALFSIIACGEKSTEDKVKELIESTINKTVDNVVLGEKLPELRVEDYEYGIARDAFDSTEFAVEVTYTIKGIQEKNSVIFDKSTYEPKELGSVRCEKVREFISNHRDSLLYENAKARATDTIAEIVDTTDVYL